ncbi:hypothetical protein Rs2_27180 [Raphanus sativus]|nr:hypothetical protein Rs2_27180 [Raphanus sativus]
MKILKLHHFSLSPNYLRLSLCREETLGSDCVSSSDDISASQPLSSPGVTLRLSLSPPLSLSPAVLSRPVRLTLSPPSSLFLRLNGYRCLHLSVSLYLRHPLSFSGSTV